MSNALNPLANAASSAFGSLVTAVRDRVQSVRGVVADKMGEAVLFVVGLGPRLWEAGVSLINNLKDGIVQAFWGLLDDVRNRLSELRNMLPGSEPRDPSSPLRGLAQRGKAIALNMIPGLQSGMDELTGAMRGGLEAAAETTTTSSTWNVTAQYGYQPERALRDDIRLLQLMGDV
jgi:hypothetical protein